MWYRNCDCESDEELQQVEQGIENVQGVISGIIGSLRADVGFGKRTQDNADEIIDYLNLINNRLEEI